MLFLITILFVVSAILLLAVWLKSRNPNRLTEKSTPILSNNYRSLFAPSEEELRASVHQENLQIEARKRDEARQLVTEKISRATDFRKIWRSNSTKLKTIDLLRISAESESAELFQDTVEDVLEAWKANQIKGLSLADLIQLVESHFWLLPSQERTSGIKFWLKEELVKLI